MERYDPERLELSTRDRVALANYTEIAEGRGTEHGGVLLDISHLDRELVLRRLPRMYRQFIDLAMLDITSTPMEVAPTAHYSMGGVWVDAETHATDVEGLYAVGECASGVHGANRLGGNSLAEAVVFGRIVGAEAARWSAQLDVQARDHAAIAAAREEVDELLPAAAKSSRGRSSGRCATSCPSAAAWSALRTASGRAGAPRRGRRACAGHRGAARHRRLRRPRPRPRLAGLATCRAGHARVRARASRDARRTQPRGLPRARSRPASGPRLGRRRDDCRRADPAALACGRRPRRRAGSRRTRPLLE